jgi:hypothetical protein
VNLSLIILRNTDKEAYRAWKIPGSLKIKIKGKRILIPIVSLIGLISCTTIWLLVVSYHPAGRILGTAWIIAGLIGYIVYRRRNNLRLLSREGSRLVKPSAYVLNALVLIRVPEDYEKVAKAIKDSMDRRFRLVLLTIIDPEEHGFSLEEVRQYNYIKKAEEDAYKGLDSIARKLKNLRYECEVRAEVGPQLKIVEMEAKSDENDLIVLIKRRTLKGHWIKGRDKSVQSLVSKYPGKLMVIRRE